MLWIHGGGYCADTAANYPIDDMVAASPDVVVVSINYRLNILGFLASPAIANRSTDGGAGNFGIQDQRLAMQWSRDHVASFGGDPGAITIFGQSAGGNSVLNHLTQKASWNSELYHRAIIQSGLYDEGARTMAAATPVYARVLNHSSCLDLECMLKLDGAALLDDWGGDPAFCSSWGPVVDGVSLSKSPRDLVAARDFNSKVPLMVGSNRDEAAAFTSEVLSRGGWGPAMPNVNSSLTEEGFIDYVTSPRLLCRFPRELAPQITALYALNSTYPYPSGLGQYSSWWWAATRLTTDLVPGLGACGARNGTRLFLEGGTPAVYSYLFAHAPLAPYSSPSLVPGGGTPGLSQSSSGANPGANNPLVEHGAEIPFVMAFGRSPFTPSGQEEEVLSRAMRGYWTSFAAEGTPRGNVSWPQYDALGDRVLRLDTAAGGSIRVQSGLRLEACDFLDGFVRPF
jgi:para-nitrobenzyl esterase